MRRNILLLVTALVVTTIVTGCGDDTATSSPVDTGIWKQAYGGLSSDLGFSLVQTSDGGYLVAGLTHSAGAGGGDMLLLKIDSIGDSLWSKTIGGAGFDMAFSIADAGNGTFVIAGVTESFGAGDRDVYLVKVNAAGDTVWSRTYGGAGKDEGQHVILADDGGFLIAGMTESSGAGGSDAFVIKVDSTGAVEWSHTYGGAERDYAQSCVQTLDGGYAIVGTTHSSGAGESDVFVIRLQSDGTQVWAKPLGESGEEQGKDIIETSTGTLWIVGSSDSFQDGTDSYVRECGGTDAYVLMVNQDGNKVSSSGMGATGTDYLNSLVETSDGRVIGLGYSQSPQGWWGIYVVQVSPFSGTVHQQSNLYGTAQYCWANGAIVDNNGDIMAVGVSQVTGNVDVLVYNIGQWMN